MHQRAIYAIVQAGLVERHKFRCSRRSYRHGLCRGSAHLTNQCRMGPRARSFLVAKCHVAKENWEEALQVLGESPVRAEPELSSRLSIQLLICAHRLAAVLQAEAGGGEVGDEDYSSSMSLLRGTVPYVLDCVVSRLPRHASPFVLRAVLWIL
eukprot:COSAG02_NODE_684_length_18490_cov_14.283019_4_plen_153_part_00